MDAKARLQLVFDNLLEAQYHLNQLHEVGIVIKVDMQLGSTMSAAYAAMIARMAVEDKLSELGEMNDEC